MRWLLARVLDRTWQRDQALQPEIQVDVAWQPEIQRRASMPVPTGKAPEPAVPEARGRMALRSGTAA